MLIGEKEQKSVREHFADMKRRVQLVMFETSLECPYCAQTRQLIEELGALSDKLEIKIYNLHSDADMATKYGIDKVPAMVILDETGTDFGIRLYGIPSGYEFSTLIEDVLMVSTGETTLSDSTVQFLQGLESPVHMQVFITPTCPYCPGAVRFAHMAAFVSDQVTGDMVEATEFPELSGKYGVYGVPKTVVNEVESVEGAVPEEQFVATILQAVS